MDNSRRLIRLKEVVARTGLSRSSIYKRIEDGTFPKQKHLGGRSVAWQESDIEAWFDAHGCTAQPDKALPPPQITNPPKLAKRKQIVEPEPEAPIVFTISSEGELSIKSFNTVLLLSKKQTASLKRFLL